MKLQEYIKNFPDTPGIYFFKKGSRLLYIGKATSLKDRVKSYFSKHSAEARGPLILEMLGKATSLNFEETESVLEALLLETRLIKKYQPSYNTISKDDKSYNHMVITKEEFPRVLLVREKALAQEFSPEKLLYDIGPFPHGLKLKEALKIIRKIFPFRDICTPLLSPPVQHRVLHRGTKRGCFNAEIGLCPGVCRGAISSKEYKKEIRKLILFLEGNKKKLLRTLEREMKTEAQFMRFEEALKLKRKIFALKHVNDIGLIKKSDFSSALFSAESGSSPRRFRAEGYDIAHFAGREMVGVMTVLEDGRAAKNEYRKFRIRGFTQSNDPGALREILSRRFAHHEWQFPNLLVVDGNKVQKDVAESVLKEHGRNIPVVAVVKDKRHKPRAILGDKKIARERHDEILLANAEAHRFALSYHHQKRRKNFLL